MNLIEIKNLKTYFHTEGGLVKSVDDVSLSIPIGKTLGVVGESGCGKSVTAMSILQLVAHPGKIDGGEILLLDSGCLKQYNDGNDVPNPTYTDLVQMSEQEIRKIIFELSIPYFFFGRFAPYFDLACIRPVTPWVSNVPRMIW